MRRRAFFVFFILLFLYPAITTAAVEPKVEHFSPQSTVKKVRQVSARFSEQMVSFGDPRLADPFDISCSEKGKGRWADSKNWVFDFERDLPAGIACEFTLKHGLTSLSGRQIQGQRIFFFDTGGPAIIESHPYEGSEYLNEDQVFILFLDAEPVEESVIKNTFLVVEGLNEKIGVRIIKGTEKEDILKTRYRRAGPELPQILLQARQTFPADAKVRLIWGKDIASAGGIKTTKDQILHFKTRGPFIATFNCERENVKADCIPLLPMYLNFSSPVPYKFTETIIMKGSGDKTWKPAELNAERRDDYLYSVTFQGPFPEKSSFTIELPKDMTDDAGRMLSNTGKFPLPVKTDFFPPLAKFSARFGIIELAEPVLPVTVRNIENEIKTRMVGVNVPGEKDIVQEVKGRIGNIPSDNEEEIIEWVKRIASAKREASIFENSIRAQSMDKLHIRNNLREMTVPKPGGSKAFEVVGIPLDEAGFYVAEIESRILGSALLGKPKPLYVPATALVTNLSAHFKWGRESSLVWVTTLNDAAVVPDAEVHIRDCRGKLVWEGKTDDNGIARINSGLPDIQELPACNLEINYREAEPALNSIGGGLFVFARKADDLTFVHSGWDNGIEPWRFNLPEASYRGPFIAHSVLDRTLLRAGDTVHMKHVIRKHTTEGFSYAPDKDLPRSALIQHTGSAQRYEFPLKWDANGISETGWKIPKEATLGTYEITLLKKPLEKTSSRTDIGRTAVGGYEAGDEEYFVPDGWPSGSFRVEEFRVPLMKAILQPPAKPQVNASEVDIDIMLSYLSGGGAGNTPVKLRGFIQPKRVFFQDYEDFLFANGEIKEGIKGRSGFAEAEEQRPELKQTLRTQEITLDKGGASRTKITGLPHASLPQDLLAEVEYRDPNGEIQTVSAHIPLWTSGLLVGIKPDSWALSKESFKFHIAVLDLNGNPVAKAPVKVEMFRKIHHSHRKRLVGGFYAYEHLTEIKREGSLCEGATDSKGMLICEAQSAVSGNIIIQAQAVDESGNKTIAHQDVWVAGKEDWWFDVSDNDRIDLLPEKKRYEPGDTARFQVRMPFREATALITVEREGIIDTFIKKLSGKAPAVEIPVKGHYAPNVFVSALIVRGRVSEPQPAAMADLGRPAYKLGISGINVGWKAHELKVSVEPEETVYKIREKARVRIKVRRADESLLSGSNDKAPASRQYEVAVAAVDEGLLELMPNQSWKLLEAMMGRRGYEILTSTAQMQVVGKRHYGLKALPQGGGGGRQTVRELFDTLLYWNPRVITDKNGEAVIEIPLNDSLTGFRIAAIASSGNDLFGEGEAGIRTTQDIMLLSGIPPLVREGDTFKAGFTIRNASDRNMRVKIAANFSSDSQKQTLKEIQETLSAGEAREIGWDITVPLNIDRINYEVTAKEIATASSDVLRVTQKVAEAVPARIFQATMTQIEQPYSLDIKKPEVALPAKGGLSVTLRPKLSNGLGGVQWFMKRYPYTCMEQKVSKAVALRDNHIRDVVIAELPAYIDSDGLVKYFPCCSQGSDTLTSYILSVSREAGWDIPEDLREKMEEGLKGFIEGRIIRWSSLPTADVSIRKMAAVEALSRNGKATTALLASIIIEPNLWPTSAVLDWINVLSRLKGIPARDKKLNEALQALRSRLNYQGTTLGFSSERSDNLWWLMISSDVNAVKTILTMLEFNLWNSELPQLAKGALNRQVRGYWNTTTANAWGVLAMEKFSEKFEAVPVTGITSALTTGAYESLDWQETPSGGSIQFAWQPGQNPLTIAHEGTGRPWATIQSLAAIPLKEPFSSGYRINKSIIPVEQKNKGVWTRGDVMRVRLEIEAQTDMTWVVVNDPVPAGSAILGTGLGRDSGMLTKDQKQEGWTWPAFEERSHESFRAYYEFVPKGKWTVEYTLRLNNEGTFNLPSTRAEALYAPEMLGELPNEKITVLVK